MRIFKQENIKKILILSIVAITICTCVFAVLTLNQRNSYIRILNNTISSVISKVVVKYPNITEEEILDIINSKTHDKTSLLEKYGYDKEAIYIKQIKDDMQEFIIINIIFIIVFGITITTIFIIYFMKENKKINEINQYLEKINNKDYTLKIEDNKEGELSKLRNELYKTTVLLKETAENSENEKEQLSTSLADISHQLKTPITSIRILLDNINENPDMDESTKSDFIKEISKQVDWISSLVISLLKLSKFDSGTIQMNNTMIDVEKLISDVIGNLSILLDIKNIEVIKDIEGEATFVGDYKWQKEALTNILKNAIEHSPEDSKIHIKVEDCSVFLKIKIIDEGVGIEKEDVKHIFERFYKSKGASEDSIGIGLSLAKIIIEKNGGYIMVDSKINKGTTFEIKYIK